MGSCSNGKMLPMRAVVPLDDHSLAAEPTHPRTCARPPKPETTEPGEFAHGWQHLASSANETRYKEDVVAAKLGRAHTALWKSQRGPCAGAHLTALPTQPETKYTPVQLRTLLLRRLRLPLQLAPRTCKCGQLLDQLGDHRAACAVAGSRAAAVCCPCGRGRGR